MNGGESGPWWDVEAPSYPIKRVHELTLEQTEQAIQDVTALTLMLRSLRDEEIDSALSDLDTILE